MLVPDDAVALDQGGRYVLVVGDKDVVEYRRVEVGTARRRHAVVQKGVATGDWIVVNGLQRARPGSTVKPTRAAATAASAADVLPLLHRPADLRQRHRHRHDAHRRSCALCGLPIEQYPEITPPTVQVTTTYPGANAQVVADTVAAPIEQQVNGVENMLYMSSTSVERRLVHADGHVRDRHRPRHRPGAGAEPRRDRRAAAAGGSAAAGRDASRSSRPNIILVVALTSPDDTYDSLFLGNYATLRMRDELSRVAGVGDVTVFGAGNYSMRVWLDPEKLKARSLTTQDVLAAIREQNVQVAAGQVGQPPAPDGAGRSSTRSTTLGRLSDVEQFENIIVKTGDGTRVDAAEGRRPRRARRRRPTTSSTSSKRPADRQHRHLPAPRRQRAATSPTACGRSMERLEPSFPEGMEYDIPLDTTQFVEAVDPRGLQDAARSRRAGADRDPGLPAGLAGACSIPATTVPVTIIGAFAAMAALGLHGQHADAVRPGAGDRHRGRRRDRDRRERRAPHRAAGCRRSEATIKAMDEVTRADHRHHAGADGGVPADGVPGRHHRPALPAVRAHDRRHGAHQRDQRRHAQAGPVRRVAAAASRGKKNVFFRGFNRGLRPRRARLHRRSSAAWCGTWRR